MLLQATFKSFRSPRPRNRNKMTKISGDEAQIYDRQIRLWGMEAQNRLRNSSVLLIGLTGLGAEIAKNLMLSGLKSLILMDENEVSESDRSSNFFIVSDKKKNRAEASYDNVKLLNPMVELIVSTESPLSKSEEFFTQFDLVIVVDQSFETANSINKICRKNKIRFQAGGIFGWVGFAFFDFNNHTFLVPKPKETEAIIESVLDDDDEEQRDGVAESSESGAKRMKINGAGGSSSASSHPPPVTLTIGDEEDSKIKKDIPFPSFDQTFNVELGTKRFLRRRFNFPSTYFVVRSFLRTMCEDGEMTQERVVAQWKKELETIGSSESKQKIDAEEFSLLIQPALCPVCAIVGSVIGQEAIKALSQNDVPLRNTFFYSALEGNGTVVDMMA